MVPHSELAAGRSGSYYARVYPDPQEQRATLKLCRDADMEAAGLTAGLTEETIIHELLHLRLDPMSSLAEDAAFEIGLDCLAAELVRMARVERRKR